MKDVDPNGFAERRPRWKQVTIAGLLHCGDVHLQGSSAPSTPSQHHSRVMAHPLAVDHSTDTHLEMEAHPVPQSLDYSNGHRALNVQPLEFELFPGTGFTGGDSTLPTGGQDIGSGGLDDGIGAEWQDIGSGDLDVGIRADWHMDNESAPLLNSEAPRTTGSIAVGNHTRDAVETNPSLLPGFQVDAPCCDNRGDDQVQPSSRITGTTRMASGCSTPVLVPTQSEPETDTVSMGESEASAESGELFRTWF